MADKAKWARRVAEWRSSGLTSAAFCEGKSFTASGLRHGAYRLRLEKEARRRRTVEEPAVRIGRVVRGPAPVTPATREAPTDAAMVASASAPQVPPSEASLVVELGAARVMVRPGVDRATLATVLDVLAARGGTR